MSTIGQMRKLDSEKESKRDSQGAADTDKNCIDLLTETGTNGTSSQGIHITTCWLISLYSAQRIKKIRINFTLLN